MIIFVFMENKGSCMSRSLKWWMSLSMVDQVKIGLKYNEPTFNLTLRTIMFEFEQSLKAIGGENKKIHKVLTMAEEKTISLIDAKAHLNIISNEIESSEANESLQILYEFIEQEKKKRIQNGTYFLNK